MQIFASCIGVKYNALTDDQCQRLVQLGSTLQETQAKVLNSREVLAGHKTSMKDTEMYSEVRKTKLLAYDHDPLVREVGFYVNQLVNDYLQIIPVDINPQPNIQFAKYDTVGDKFDWHNDDSFDERTWDLKHQIEKNNHKWHYRKITAICQISDPNDYQGCDLEFKHHKHEDDNPYRERGTVLIFPSFMFHRVTPLLSGTRYSLTYWYQGPIWR